MTLEQQVYVARLSGHLTRRPSPSIARTVAGHGGNLLAGCRLQTSQHPYATTDNGSATPAKPTTFPRSMTQIRVIPHCQVWLCCRYVNTSVVWEAFFSPRCLLPTSAFQRHPRSCALKFPSMRSSISKFTPVTNGQTRSFLSSQNINRCQLPKLVASNTRHQHGYPFRTAKHHAMHSQH